MRTSFHHQPEAQHAKYSAIHIPPADYTISGRPKRSCARNVSGDMQSNVMIGNPEPGANMRRRELSGVLGGTAAAWPLGARAQHSRRMWRIGSLSAGSSSSQSEPLKAFTKK